MIGSTCDRNSDRAAEVEVDADIESVSEVFGTSCACSQ